jgi:cation transport ATPase
MHGDNCIKVGDLGSSSKGPSKTRAQHLLWPSESEEPESLMVGINGRVAGLIHFGRSNRLEAISALNQLRATANLQIGILSDEPLPSLAWLAESLGVDFQVGNQSPDDRVRLLRNFRRRGLKVAYVGDCRNDPRMVIEAHVAVSLVGNDADRPEEDPAPVWLLESRLSRLAELSEIARIHRRRVRVAHGYALIPNILCVAGAFAWGFTSLASVVISNLGTYGVYARTRASIRRLERQFATSRGSRSTRTSTTETPNESRSLSGG